MDYIQTVTGKVNVSEINKVDSHTHLIAYALPQVIKENIDFLLNSTENIKKDLDDFKNLGGNLIIEMSTCDYGYDVKKLKQLSLETGVNIVAAAGFNKGKYNRYFLEHYDEDYVVSKLLQDCEFGIVDGIKPGVIKMGTSENQIYPWEEKGLHAVSKVSLKTGLPIATHTQNGTMALEQLAIFNSEGVPYDQIILCHLDQLDDYELHRKIIQKGVFLSYDSVAKVKYKTRERALNYIVSFAKEGLHKQLLLGNDFARRSNYLGYNGSPGMVDLFKNFENELYQKLIDNGFTHEETNLIISDLYIENPKRAFKVRERI